MTATHSKCPFDGESFAVFHLEQAAEKLVKALRLGRGLRVTADQRLIELLTH